MSLVTLKRKSAAKHSKISSSRYSKNGFSLNNPRRIHSKSGKEQYQTPMKGNVPRGHGQKLGYYPINIVKSQYTNSDNFIRTFTGNQGISVKNNSASISVRNKWMKRGYPHYWVQPMGDEKDYAVYLEDKKKQIAKSADGSEASETGICRCKPKLNDLEGNGISKRVDVMDQSEYMQTRLMKKECLPQRGKNAHYPPKISRSTQFGCYDNYSYDEFLEKQEKDISDDAACN